MLDIQDGAFPLVGEDRLYLHAHRDLGGVDAADQVDEGAVGPVKLDEPVDQGRLCRLHAVGIVDHGKRLDGAGICDLDPLVGVDEAGRRRS